MRHCWIAAVSLCLTGGTLVRADAPSEATELLRNPGFTVADGATLPEHWSAWEPLATDAACTIRGGADGLAIDAPGRPFAVGGIWQEVEGITAGSAYAITVDCTAAGLVSPMRSILIRVLWLREGRPVHPAGQYVRGPSLDGDLLRFDDVLVAPEEADGARVSVELKWPQGGRVVVRRASMKPSDPPQPRKVKIGTVHMRPRGSTPEKNLELFCERIDEAGRLGLDIVCLPEAITQIGTTQNAAELAEPIPGPTSKRLGEAARRNRVWVVACYSERDGEHVYNTAVLIDRASWPASIARFTCRARNGTRGLHPAPTTPSSRRNSAPWPSRYATPGSSPRCRQSTP